MRSVVGALVLVGMLALSGCIDGDPLPTLPPTPSSTPIFASDEEALAAAEEAYAAYNEVSALISSEGGANPERISGFVTDEQFQDELAIAAFYREQNLHTEGFPVIVRTDLQQAAESNGVAEIVIYACMNIDAVRVVDSLGNDVTPADRQSPVALEVAFQGSDPSSLLVASSTLWSDPSYCSA